MKHSEIGFTLLLSSLFLGSCHKDAGGDVEDGSLDPDVPPPSGTGLTDGGEEGPVFDAEAEIADCEAKIRDPEYKKTLDAVAAYGSFFDTCREFLPEFRAQQKFIINGAGLTDLRIFQYAYNARFIDITDNAVRDLSPLKDHPYLQTLGVNSNLIDDLGALGSLPNLQQFYLNDNAVTSFESMAVMPKLDKLLVERNHIQDASPLVSRAPNLQGLSLTGNPLGTSILIDERNCPMDTAKVGNALGIAEECLHLKGLQTP